MDEIYQKIAAFNPRKPRDSPDVLTFEVTELWRNEATGAVKAFDRVITVPDVATWLAEETRPSRTGDDESLALRLVWTDLDFDKDSATVGLPGPTLFAILAKFGLGLAYNYCLSCVSGANTAFSKTTAPNSEQQAHAFCYAPKLASVWSHTTFKDAAEDVKPVMNGIVLARDKQKIFLRKLIHSKWQPNFSSHPMFPAFLFAFMLSAEIEMTVANMKPRIQEVETRTGYQSFESKRKGAASGLLGELSAEMSGFASKLASAERKSKAIENLMRFILDRSNDPATIGGAELMRHHTGVLQERLGMQVTDKAYTLKRVQIQIEALVNLIGQHDSINNTDIALSSHRDASSMKTLAVVTMFFLPGSFVSALFSTNCFNWSDAESSNSIGLTLTPQFSLYWAITIPMTVITFLLYFAWLFFQAWQREKFHTKAASVRSSSDSTEKEKDEAKLLSRRRFSISLTK